MLPDEVAIGAEAPLPTDGAGILSMGAAESVAAAPPGVEDILLPPPGDAKGSSWADAAAAGTCNSTILSTLASNDAFSILVSLIRTAGGCWGAGCDISVLGPCTAWRSQPASRHALLCP